MHFLDGEDSHLQTLVQLRKLILQARGVEMELGLLEKAAESSTDSLRPLANIR